jgi:N-acetylglucosaminyldiphosphoundecaprenol N-acetyl-beta-D-mannosaminyltransferase
LRPRGRSSISSTVRRSTERCSPLLWDQPVSSESPGASRFGHDLVRKGARALEQAVADRACILGCEIDCLDMPHTVARIAALIDERRYTQHVAINAAKVVAMHDDPHLRPIIDGCGLVSADGQSIVWASRLLRDPVPERVAGIDLMQALLELAERRGYRVYFLGATAATLDRALARIRDRHPALIIAGARDGYFGEEQSAEVAAEAAATRPDIVFVAMPSPRKEYWLGRHGPDVGASFVMGVGGSIDVLAGMVRRAPVILQRAGLEWCWRLAQEPRRLLRRYIVTNLRFLRLLALELCAQRVRRFRTAPPH